MKKPATTNKPTIAAALMLITAASSVPPSVYASEPQTTAQSQTATGSGAAAATGFPSPAEVVSRLQTKLSLSAEQTSALTPIITSRQEKLKALLSDSNSRPLKRRRELQGIVSESDKQINALLTPEQQKQYAEIEKQMREELKQRMRERHNADEG